jgi:hypothetical protein
MTDSQPEIHFDDAFGWLVKHLASVLAAREQRGYRPQYECDLWLPDVIRHLSAKRGLNVEEFKGRQAELIYSPFYDAAWELCRRGILRPGKITPRGQSMRDALGDQFSITEFGMQWVAEQNEQGFFVPNDPGRLTEILLKFEPRFGHGFKQRAAEAVACHRVTNYLACCVMAGAASESILLAVAIEKSGDEAATLKEYGASKGRKTITDKIGHGLSGGLTEQFKSLCSLLNYWRDQAGHGTASTISEIEAFHAISRLLRFAQFADDNWSTLTKP